MNAQILKRDAVRGERCSKSTTPLIWLETVQSTHLDAAYSPGRGCSSEALIHDTSRRYGKTMIEQLGASQRATNTKIRSITADPDLLAVIEELSGNAISHDMRYRILAFEIQRLRARLQERGST